MEVRQFAAEEFYLVLVQSPRKFLIDPDGVVEYNPGVEQQLLVAIGE